MAIDDDGMSSIEYKNPVGGMTDIGDPFVLKVNNIYYMYATSEPTHGFKVWQSSNLVDWDDLGLAYSIKDQTIKWAIGDFWAPEVVAYNHMFYMTYSARNKQGHLQISIAISESPAGPFMDISREIIKQEGSYIDGHLLIDENDIPYLYYVKDCSENIINDKHVSQIFVQKMNKELTRLLGNPRLLLEPDAKWEGLEEEFIWNEGPFVVVQNKKYYLMYSANHFAKSDYSIGYAVSDRPMGPFIKATENPILAKKLDIEVSGPGHNSVIVGPDNETLYIVYHIHTDAEHPSGDRQMSIDRLYFEDEKMKVDGPTRGGTIIKMP